MNYKLLSMILGVGLIGSNAYFLSNQQSIQKLKYQNIKGEEFNITQEHLIELREFNEVIYVDDAATNKGWEERNTIIDSLTTGAAISEEMANKKIKKFTDWNNQFGNLTRPIKPFGYAYGKGRIRAMLKKIDEINSKLIDESEKIYGVRLYLSFTPRPGQATRNHLDLTFVPIKRNGKPYHNLLSASKLNEGDDNSLLNTSAPCPNECK